MTLFSYKTPRPEIDINLPDETESDNYIYNLAGLWPLAFGGSQRRGNNNNNNNNNLAGLDEYNNDDNLDAFYNEMMG